MCLEYNVSGHFSIDLNDEVLYIKSPNYSLGYPHNSNSSWTIKAATNTTIDILFKDINIENCSACIEVSKPINFS